MDSKADAKVRSKQNRSTRVKRVIERFDFENGTWHRMELYDDDEIVEMSPELRDAYIDIVTSISDMMAVGYNYNESN
jgi:hypothetical protein